MPPNRMLKKKKPTRKEVGKPVTGNDVFKLVFFPLWGLRALKFVAYLHIGFLVCG